MNLWYFVPSAFIGYGLWIAVIGGAGLLIGGIPIFCGVVLHLLYLILRQLTGMHTTMLRQASVPPLVRPELEKQGDLHDRAAN